MMTLLQVEQVFFLLFLLDPRKSELHGLIEALPVELVREMLAKCKTVGEK